jgi:hypothetical protein
LNTFFVSKIDSFLICGGMNGVGVIVRIHPHGQIDLARVVDAGGLPGGVFGFRESR